MPTFKVFKHDLNQVAAEATNRDAAMLIAFCNAVHTSGDVAAGTNCSTNCNTSPMSIEADPCRDALLLLCTCN